MQGSGWLPFLRPKDLSSAILYKKRSRPSRCACTFLPAARDFSFVALAGPILSRFHPYRWMKTSLADEKWMGRGRNGWKFDDFLGVFGPEVFHRVAEISAGPCTALFGSVPFALLLTYVRTLASRNYFPPYMCLATIIPYSLSLISSPPTSDPPPPPPALIISKDIFGEK